MTPDHRENKRKAPPGYAGAIRPFLSCTVLTGFILAFPPAASGEETEVEFHASLRLQAEMVRPDRTAALDHYTGMRDAYSRIGFRARHALGDDLNLLGHLELPLDLANGAVQDPWDQDKDVRIASIGLQGRLGAIQYGQMWMPYYNAIAYPVDMFSSYYSGFATFTSFRLGKTLSYQSPEIAGLRLALGWSRDHGAGGDDRSQFTASYRFGETTLAVGMDDLGGPFDSRILGVSLAHTHDDIYLGMKYELHHSEITSGYGRDGDHAANLYGSYRLDRTTWKIMLAEVQHYGEAILHLGLDHQYSSHLKLFAEFYREEQTAAITARRAGRDTFPAAASGGRVFALGMRYDF